MFLERGRREGKAGWVEVICGSMFSGKTEELIRRVRRARYARQSIEVFKPSMEVRYHESEIVSHDENSLNATPVDASANILLYYKGAEVVAIDEAQFFDEGLPEVCDELAQRGARVIVAGLDMDYRGNPFGSIPDLMAKSEFVTKVHAICAVCGDVALYSYRLSEENKQVMLGEKESYEPRCRKHFVEGMKSR